MTCEAKAMTGTVTRFAGQNGNDCSSESSPKCHMRKIFALYECMKVILRVPSHIRGGNKALSPRLFRDFPN